MCSLAVRICVILMSMTVINASNSGASLQILKQIGQSAISNIQQTIKSNIRAKINNVRSQIFSVSNSVSAQSSSSHSPVMQHGYNEFDSYYDHDLGKYEEHNGGSYSYDSSPYYYEHPHSYQDFNFNTIPNYHY